MNHSSDTPLIREMYLQPKFKNFLSVGISNLQKLNSRTTLQILHSSEKRTNTYTEVKHDDTLQMLIYNSQQRNRDGNRMLGENPTDREEATQSIL